MAPLVPWALVDLSAALLSPPQRSPGPDLVHLPHSRLLPAVGLHQRKGSWAVSFLSASCLSFVTCSSTSVSCLALLISFSDDLLHDPPSILWTYGLSLSLSSCRIASPQRPRGLLLVHRLLLFDLGLNERTLSVSSISLPQPGERWQPSPFAGCPALFFFRRRAFCSPCSLRSWSSRLARRRLSRTTRGRRPRARSTGLSGSSRRRSCNLRLAQCLLEDLSVHGLQDGSREQPDLLPSPCSKQETRELA